MQFLASFLFFSLATIVVTTHALPHHGDAAHEMETSTLESANELPGTPVEAPDWLMDGLVAEAALGQRPEAPVGKWQTASIPGNQVWLVDIVCETSKASPEFLDVRGAISTLAKKAGQWCIQTNPFGSKCQTHARYGDAAIAICGKHAYGIQCEDLERAASFVWYYCRKSYKGVWKAGGQVKWDKGKMRAILH